MDHADQPPGGSGKSRVGDRLRSEREAQSLSLDDVAARTRVPKRLLEAIERGDHDALPAPTYSAGFVKVYGQVVGLDGGELARQFREEIAHRGDTRRKPEPFEPADPARVPSRLLAFVALAVALLIGLGYAVWRGGSLWGYGADQRARLAAGTEVPEAPAAAPDAAPGAVTTALAGPAATPLAGPAAPAPAPAPAPAGPVVLTANDTVWFKVYERGGRTLFTGEIPAGQRYEVPADAVAPLIRTGRPEALQVTVGGQPVAQLGPSSKLIADVSLSRDDLLARGAAGPADAAPAPAAALTAAPVAPGEATP